jgi:hypothetical protein
MSSSLHAHQLIAAAADNLVAHFTFVQRRTAGMRVLDTAGLVLTDGGLACDTFNAVMRARLDDTTAPARVRDAVAWFAERGHPFSWWVGPGDEPTGLGAQLEAAGLARMESELAMAADLEALPAAPPPPELEIRRVRTPDELAAYARINAENWSPPDPLVEQFYDRG